MSGNFIKKPVLLDWFFYSGNTLSAMLAVCSFIVAQLFATMRAFIEEKVWNQTRKCYNGTYNE